MPAEASRMLRMLPERLITTDLAGIASRQAEILEKPEIRAAIPQGRDILLLEIKRIFGDFVKQQNIANPWIGNANGTPLLDRVMSMGAATGRATPLLPGAGETARAVGPASFQTSNDLYIAMKELAEVTKQLFRERQQLRLPGANQTGGRGVLVGGQGAEAFRESQRANARWLIEAFKQQNRGGELATIPEIIDVKVVDVTAQP